MSGMNDKHAFPLVPWVQSAPGDLVGSQDAGVYVIIVRKLRPKWRAERVANLVPGSLVWGDGPKHWAVVIPRFTP